jgi:hypothetical protein
MVISCPGSHKAKPHHYPDHNMKDVCVLFLKILATIRVIPIHN